MKVNLAVVHGTEGESLRLATTMAFMTLELFQVFHAFDASSQNMSIFFTRRLFTNGWLWGAVAICLVQQGAALYLFLLQKVFRPSR